MGTCFSEETETDVYTVMDKHDYDPDPDSIDSIDSIDLCECCGGIFVIFFCGCCG